MSRKEQLSEIDIKLIGPPRIITLPLTDKAMIIEEGDLLAGLGHQMKLYGMQGGLTTRACGLLVAAEIQRVNQLIREYAKIMEIDMPRRGRRPAAGAERSENELETAEIASFAKPLHRVPRGRR